MRPRKRILLINETGDDLGATRFALEMRGFHVVDAEPADATLRYDAVNCTVIGGDVKDSGPVAFATMAKLIDSLRRACHRRPGPKKGYKKPVASVSSETVARRTA